jgi:hypothetical protein
MIMAIFVSIIFLAIVGPMWFPYVTHAYRVKFKNGRNFKVNMEYIGPSSPFKHAVRWSVEGPSRPGYYGRKYDSGYGYSNFSMDDAFEEAKTKIEKAIEGMKPKEPEKRPAYYYEIDENGNRTNFKGN